MRIAMITPHSRPLDRGNAVTVERLGSNLHALGCSVDVWGLDECGVNQTIEEVCRGGYDLCHAFHAWHGGVVAREIGIPYLITLTGSDIYEALCDNRRRDTVDALSAASRIVAFHADIAERLEGLMPGGALASVNVIPQGVELPDREPLPPDMHEFVFLLPAGLRPVKDVLAAVPLLSALHAEDARVRLVLVGPVIDREYAASVTRAVAAHPFVACLGGVGHAEMGSLYRQAHVVLNTSLFEGGMANSLLEAMAWGRPVLASDIEGNRSLIKDGVNGLLYRNQEEFADKSARLLRDSQLCQELGASGRITVEREHSTVEEARRYFDLYGEIVSGG